MNKLENKYIDAYHVIFKEGNLNGEWCINDVNAVSKIAANAVNGIVTFTHEQNINERIKLMNKSSPDSCVKCYTMFLPFLFIKIDVFS